MEWSPFGTFIYPHPSTTLDLMCWHYDYFICSKKIKINTTNIYKISFVFYLLVFLCCTRNTITNTHTHTRRHIYLYSYLFACLCVLAHKGKNNVPHHKCHKNGASLKLLMLLFLLFFSLASSFFALDIHSNLHTSTHTHVNLHTSRTCR